MSTEQKNQAAEVEPKSTDGEGETKAETVTIPKTDYDKFHETIGSLKRQVKDYTKSKDEPKETPQKNQPDDSVLKRMEKLVFTQHNVTHPDDVELARSTAKKWNMDIEDVLGDDDFKVKLEREQTKRANATATSNIKGSGSGSQAKLTPEYWLAKGSRPTAQEVPDRKVRANILRAFMKNASSSGKQFYNS